MKQKILIVLLLACSFNATLPAKKEPSMISKALKVISFPLAPSEVAHTFEITRAADQPYTLDEDRIAQLQQMYEQNFKIRDHMAKSTYIITAASLIWLGYKWGVFDWVLPASVKKALTPFGSLNVSDPANELEVAQYLNSLNQPETNAIIANLIAQVATMKAQKDMQTGNWLVNGVKNVGWSGVSIAGNLIIQSKWYSLFPYVLSEPSFRWFLSNHSIISTVDRLKRSVQALSSPHMPVEFSQEYHTKALVPAIESIIRNTEQFIAFIDFYLPLLEDEVVKKEAMNGISRYLFNITNDFLKKINPVLNDPNNQSALIPIIDEYRADVATFINRCKLFEEEFVSPA